MLSQKKPDLICLQEVCPDALIILIDILGSKYSFQTGSYYQQHDTVMFGLKTWSWTYGKEVLFKRSVVWAKTTVNGTTFLCTTAYMQSQFFHESYTKIKANQLKQLAAILHREGGPESVMMHAGDTNLTGGSLLVGEKAGFIDMWPVLTPGFDCREIQSSELFSSKDATWRSPENSMTVKLNFNYTEHRRPDRFLLMGQSLSFVKIDTTKMNVIRPDLSDHDVIELFLSIV